MAKLERNIHGDFQKILTAIEDGILEGSVSATLEDTSDFVGTASRCSVRIFERYSYLGSNRVSLSVTLFQEADGPIFLSAITSGGSQAVFSKSIRLVKRLSSANWKNSSIRSVMISHKCRCDFYAAKRSGACAK